MKPILSTIPRKYWAYASAVLIIFLILILALAAGWKSDGRLGDASIPNAIPPVSTSSTASALSSVSSGTPIVAARNTIAGTGANVRIDLAKQFKIWTGESTAEKSARTEYGKIVTSAGVGGSAAFQAEPDQWHSGSINFENMPDVYRQSLSKYDFIQMSVKVAPLNGKSLPQNPRAVFSIYAWPNTSASVPIEKYADGGTLSSEFRTVRIPTDALAVAGGFDLSSLEFMYFGIPTGTDPAYVIIVDDIYAVKSGSNDIVKAQAISDRVIKLSLKSRYDMKSVLDASQYVLRGADRQAKSPVKIGRQIVPSGFEGSTGGSYGLSNAPMVEPILYLVFDAPFVDKAVYTLTVKNIPDTIGNNFQQPKDISFTYDDDSVTGSVQANQVGYLPVSPKFAYVGNYLGDAGALPGTPASCDIMNASGTKTKVASFPLEHRGLDAQLSGNDIYSCDFSSVTAPGTYYVSVPGFGRSYDFKIADDVYADVFRKLSDFYYNQRADIAIENGQWSRPAGTLASDQKAQLHAANYVKNDFNPLALSESGYPKSATYDMTGGWYDAGDYGKYVLPASAPINELLFAYELYPQKFQDGQADLPAGEKSDGIPDILNEVKYEMDWFQKMQASGGEQDGGVFDRLTSQDWEISPYDIHTRYLAPISTHATAVYAAATAQAARVFKSDSAFERKYPGYADDLLVKAKKAWAYLAAHPIPQPANGTDVHGLGIGGGDYQDTSNTNCRDDKATPGLANCPYSDVDNRAWAAAELYKTTGDQQYHDAFKKYWSQTEPFWGLYNNFIFHNPKASLAYVTMHQYPTDPAIVSAIKDAYRTIADEEVGYTNSGKYRVGYRMDVPSYIGWGAFAQSAAKASDLIKAYVILGDAKYLDAAKINLDAELGANPQSMSYITGVGSAYPQTPLHLTSIWLRQNSGAKAALPGIAVFGPHYRANEGNPYNAAVQSDANIYPSFHSGSYPLLRRYFDISAIVEQSEFGINTNAPILAAFAYFSK
ncbi:MAG: Cellulose 1,4-beta-cellobiosidase [Candidatus Taylorbacteria bacterium]|nr:Cellulose 1,4-beta-cellobiosidase [Candidatus Taylorbacteria bacterium]